MAYGTYFEIGGYVIESYVNDQNQLFGRPPVMTLEKKMKKEVGITAPLSKKAVNEVSDKAGIDLVKVSSAIGRKKRAHWAFRTALALSLVDGPLPIGDAIAIGGLAAYGTYEVVMLAKDMSEAV